MRHSLCMEYNVSFNQNQLKVLVQTTPIKICWAIKIIKMCGETAIVVSKCRQGLENAILIHRIPFILFGNCYGTAVENAIQTPRQRVQSRL